MVNTRSFFRAMKLTKDKINTTQDKQSAEVWLEIRDFIVQGTFSTYKKASQMSYYLLKGYSDGYIARSFGISETTVRVHVRDMSNELYNLFGKDFFELFDNYKVNKKLVDLRVLSATTVTMKARDLLPEEIITKVCNGSTVALRSGDITLNECKGEISFLARHSLDRLSSELSRLDLNKLRYLIDVLDTNVEASRRGDLISVLIGVKREEKEDEPDKL